MDKSNKSQQEMLNDIYQTCSMANHSIDTIVKDILDGKFRDLVNKQNDMYKAYRTRCEQVADTLQINVKDVGAMAKVNSYIGIKGSMMMDNSKTNIASKLIQCTVMGITTVLADIHQYPNINESIMLLAQDILKSMEIFVESLKEYV